MSGNEQEWQTRKTRIDTRLRALRWNLVAFDAVTIKSNVRMAGVFLQVGEEVGLIDPETGSEELDRLEDERQFDTTEIERKVTAPDSNRNIIQEIQSCLPPTKESRPRRIMSRKLSATATFCQKLARR